MLRNIYRFRTGGDSGLRTQGIQINKKNPLHISSPHSITESNDKFSANFSSETTAKVTSLLVTSLHYLSDAENRAKISDFRAQTPVYLISFCLS